MKKTVNILPFLFLFFSVSAQNSYLETTKLDSVNSVLNAVITKYSGDLDKYYQLSSELKEKSKEDIETELSKLKNQKSQSIKKLKSLNENINELINEVDENELIDLNSLNVQSLKGKVENQEKEHKNLRFILLKMKENKEAFQNLNSLKAIEKKYDIIKKEFEQLTKELPVGQYTFIYNQNKYFAFIADPLKHNINIIDGATSVNQRTRGISIKKLIASERNNNVQMITNGGMFDSQMLPVGLLVINRKTKKEINLGAERRNSNFFMLPNGVFYIQNDSVYVTNTMDYARKNLKPDFATQSGPMLIDNGIRHHRFNYKSPNIYNRSGVGILPNNRAVFIISEKQNTNFFDFSSIFMDIFSCKNALYLDGAISEMYLKNNNNLKIRGGSFGSLIYVETKSKN